MTKWTGLLAWALAALALTTGAKAAPANVPSTVEISGRAFVFNHMSTGISGATIKVREFPRLSAITDELGDYRLTVPNDATVTPYIVPGEGLLTQRNIDGEPYAQMQAHWNEIDLQTFHTRGEDIENANFQAPRDEEYNALKAILQVPAGSDGRPEQCVIVTTSSARNVRDVDFRTYWVNTPHGVEGATAFGRPGIGEPTYFNHLVIPDPTQPHSSNDGGIIWPVVPTGTYRIITEHPTTRFASFLATCEPGRIVNANPPMGAYELNPRERPRMFSKVAATVPRVRAYRKGGNRFVILRVKSGERVRFLANLRRGARGLATSGHRFVAPGDRLIRIRINRPRVRAGAAWLRVWLADASGEAVPRTYRVNLPPPNRFRTRRGQ